jgi:hypothetical protein
MSLVFDTWMCPSPIFQGRDGVRASLVYTPGWHRATAPVRPGEIRSWAPLAASEQPVSLSPVVFAWLHAVVLPPGAAHSSGPFHAPVGGSKCVLRIHLSTNTHRTHRSTRRLLASSSSSSHIIPAHTPVASPAVFTRIAPTAAHSQQVTLNNVYRPLYHRVIPIQQRMGHMRLIERRGQPLTGGQLLPRTRALSSNGSPGAVKLNHLLISSLCDCMLRRHTAWPH